MVPISRGAMIVLEILDNAKGEYLDDVYVELVVLNTADWLRTSYFHACLFKLPGERQPKFYAGYHAVLSGAFGVVVCPVLQSPNCRLDPAACATLRTIARSYSLVTCPLESLTFLH